METIKVARERVLQGMAFELKPDGENELAK